MTIIIDTIIILVTDWLFIQHDCDQYSTNDIIREMIQCIIIGLFIIYYSNDDEYSIWRTYLFWLKDYFIVTLLTSDSCIIPFIDDEIPWLILLFVWT